MLRVSPNWASGTTWSARGAGRRLPATELRPLGPDLAGVLTLGELIDAGGGRPDGAGLTLFKGLGTGIADLAVARLFVPAG